MAAPLVLLTGATGMIGFSILVKLLNAGYRVRAAVRTQAGFDRIAGLKPVLAHASRLESIVVPDISVPGAYAEAIRGVKYVIHVASPLADPKYQGGDLEALLVRPAIRGALEMLEAAAKEPGVERIVMTASAGSILNVPAISEGDVVNEETRTEDPRGPYTDLLHAYFDGKSLAFRAVEKFMAEEKPHFTVVNVMPTYVIGKDEHATEAKALFQGTNALVLAPLSGIRREIPLQAWICDVGDVATVHVRSLDSASLPGNRNFLVSSHTPERRTPWADVADIVRRRYPKQVADGIFDVETAASVPSGPGCVDPSVTETAFGITFKTLEQSVVSLLDYYLELSAQK